MDKFGWDIDSVFLSNLHYFYAQTDGSYAFPNSVEGDLLKQAKREIESLYSETIVVPKVPKKGDSWILCECGCGLTTTYKFCPSCGKRLDWKTYSLEFEKEYGRAEE